MQRYEPSPVSVRPLWAFPFETLSLVMSPRPCQRFGFFFPFSKTWKKSFWELKTMIPIIVFLLKKEFFPNKIKSPAELFPSCCYRWKYHTKVLTRSFFLHNLFFICESSWEKVLSVFLINDGNFVSQIKGGGEVNLCFHLWVKYLFPSSCFTC